MRKVILLIMSVLLVVAFAVPAMADVSFSGRIIDTFVTAFAPKDGKAEFNYYYLYADLTAEVDEYNTVLLEFWGSPTVPTAGVQRHTDGRGWSMWDTGVARSRGSGIRSLALTFWDTRPTRPRNLADMVIVLAEDAT